MSTINQKLEAFSKALAVDFKLQKAQIGSLPTLLTVTKTSLVDAINELVNKGLATINDSVATTGILPSDTYSRVKIDALIKEGDNSVRNERALFAGYNIIFDENFDKPLTGLATNRAEHWALYNNSGNDQPMTATVLKGQGINGSNAIRLAWGGESKNLTTKGLISYHTTFRPGVYYIIAVAARATSAPGEKTGKVVLGNSNHPGWANVTYLNQPELTNEWQWTIMRARKPVGATGYTRYNELFITVETGYIGSSVEFCLPYISEGTEWAGYKTVQYSKEIKPYGQNLFSRRMESVGYISNTGNLLGPDYNNTVSDFIPVTPGENYIYQSWQYIPTAETFAGPWTGYGFYTADKKFIARQTVGGYYFYRDNPEYAGRSEYIYYEKLNIWIPSNAAYIRIGSRHLLNPQSRVKFEKGTVSTDWSPAHEDIASILLTDKPKFALTPTQEPIEAKVKVRDIVSNIHFDADYYAVWEKPTVSYNGAPQSGPFTFNKSIKVKVDPNAKIRIKDSGSSGSGAWKERVLTENEKAAGEAIIDLSPYPAFSDTAEHTSNVAIEVLHINKYKDSIKTVPLSEIAESEIVHKKQFTLSKSDIHPGILGVYRLRDLNKTYILVDPMYSNSIQQMYPNLFSAYTVNRQTGSAGTSEIDLFREFGNVYELMRIDNAYTEMILKTELGTVKLADIHRRENHPYTEMYVGNVQVDSWALNTPGVTVASELSAYKKVYIDFFVGNVNGPIYAGLRAEKERFSSDGKSLGWEEMDMKVFGTLPIKIADRGWKFADKNEADAIIREYGLKSSPDDKPSLIVIKLDSPKVSKGIVQNRVTDLETLNQSGGVMYTLNVGNRLRCQSDIHSLTNSILPIQRNGFQAQFDASSSIKQFGAWI